MAEDWLSPIAARLSTAQVWAERRTSVPETAIPFVSVTRVRVRSLVHLPGFVWRTQRSIAQIRRAGGFLGGALLPDRRMTFWTLTLWVDGEAMRSFMSAGAHRRAMPSIVAASDEASVVHWEQAEAKMPSWTVAAERMRREGRPTKLRQPSADHLAMTFAEPRLNGGGGAIEAARRR